MDNQKKKNIIIGVVLGLIAIAAVILLLVRGCDKKEYLVKFISENKVVQTEKVKENETVAKPIDPTREGYSFVGWYLGNKEFDFKTKITKDITLKAKWKSAELKLKASEIELKVGEEKLIELLDLPEGVTKDDIIYEVSDDSIATVDKNGNLVAKKAGKVKVTVKTKDGKYKGAVTVTVKEEEKSSEEVAPTNQTTTNTTTSKKTTSKKSSGSAANNSGSSTPAPSNPQPSQPAQPSQPQKADSYTISIVKLQTQDGSIYQYQVGGATKNGSTISFSTVKLGNSYYTQGMNVDSSIGTPSSATLMINGQAFNATISWSTRTVQ